MKIKIYKYLAVTILTITVTAVNAAIESYHCKQSNDGCFLFECGQTNNMYFDFDLGTIESTLSLDNSASVTMRDDGMFRKAGLLSVSGPWNPQVAGYNKEWFKVIEDSSTMALDQYVVMKYEFYINRNGKPSYAKKQENFGRSKVDLGICKKTVY